MLVELVCETRCVRQLVYVFSLWAVSCTGGGGVPIKDVISTRCLKFCAVTRGGNCNRVNEVTQLAGQPGKLGTPGHFQEKRK